MCSGRLGEAPYWMWVCCRMVTKVSLSSKYPYFFHHYCHILLSSLVCFLSLIVDLPLWIPYPSPSTISVLWNFCVHLSILLLNRFFHQSLPFQKAGLLGQEGNGTSCCVHLCVTRFGKNSEHHWWERKDGLMIGLSLEDLQEDMQRLAARASAAVPDAYRII